MNLETYLRTTCKDINLSETYIHVIREPNASRDWKWVAEQVAEGAGSLNDLILEAALFDTCHNKADVWKKAKNVAVLLDCHVPNSPYRHLSGQYLFLGVLHELVRLEGFGNDVSGLTWLEPAGTAEWMHTDGAYVFSHLGLPRGWKFKATGDKSTAAKHFVLQENVSRQVVYDTYPRLRGWQLSFDELRERIKLPNWRQFLNTPGVYLIQVRDPDSGYFYRYIGKALSLRDRWETYAGTKGTAGEKDGNKHLRALYHRMERRSPGSFTDNWRIQVVRVADRDEVKDVEPEMKKAFCTYASGQAGTPEAYQSPLGLNGN